MQPVLLCIDDDIDDLELFCEAVHLVDPNFVCYTADGGRKAISMLDGMVELPSFVFLDLQMHEMSGLDTLSAIRNNPRYRDIEIVVFSGAANPSHIEQCKSFGVRHFLNKDSNFRFFCNAITGILKSRNR